ncbi:thiosulfate oxidation carrier protein SoxY [Pseudogemmobacter faecipullorum]|nr:thiosulfate oxidation carrier protein SoxY [Pseudogemmobacter faecipullorum]
MTSYADLNRRQLLGSGAALGAAALLGAPPALAQTSTATARADTTESDRIALEFLAGTTAAPGGLALDLPALGDNPAAVPVRAYLTGELSDDLWCEELIVLAERNPMPLACRFRFTPLTGTADVAVRLRLIGSMHIRALARMSDGRCFDIRQEITVAAGGCGL